jgi:hypothetical protein
MATKKQRFVTVKVMVDEAQLRKLKRYLGTKNDSETLQRLIADRLSAEEIFAAAERIRKRGTWVDTYGRTTQREESSKPNS